MGYVEEDDAYLVDEVNYLGTSEKTISVIDPFGIDTQIHWKSIEAIFRYAFDVLRVDLLQTPLLISGFFLSVFVLVFLIMFLFLIQSTIKKNQQSTISQHRWLLSNEEPERDID